jgi:hypothetical protein
MKIKLSELRKVIKEEHDHVELLGRLQGLVTSLDSCSNELHDVADLASSLGLTRVTDTLLSAESSGMQEGAADTVARLSELVAELLTTLES